MNAGRRDRWDGVNGDPCRCWRENPRVITGRGYLRCQFVAGHEGPHRDCFGEDFTDDEVVPEHDGETLTSLIR